MKRQFLVCYILATLSLISPNQLFAETNSNAQIDRIKLREQTRRDGESLARQNMIESLELQTMQCKATVNMIRLKVGLKAREKAPDSSKSFSSVWDEWGKSKIELIDATHRRQVAGTMSEAELTAAARLYPTMKTSPDGTVTELNAQELLANMDADIGVAKQKCEALAGELGITNEAVVLDSEVIKELQTAERDWAIKQDIENEFKKRLESEAQQGGPGYPPQGVGSPDP